MFSGSKIVSSHQSAREVLRVFGTNALEMSKANFVDRIGRDSLDLRLDQLLLLRIEGCATGCIRIGLQSFLTGALPEIEIA
jgi:hypothetical protein